MQELSEFGESLIQSFESCQLEAYPDPATHGEPITIGWGHTNRGVIKLGDQISQSEADMLFKEDVKKFSDAVRKATRVPINDYQFSALVCFAYNLGPDGLKGRTLFQKLNTGDYIGASLSFLLYIYAGGQKNNGLINRRSKEQAVFNAGIMQQQPDFDKLSSISQYHLTVEAIEYQTSLSQLFKDYEEYKKMDIPIDSETPNDDANT